MSTNYINISYMRDCLLDLPKTLLQAYTRPQDLSPESRRTVGYAIVCFATLALLYLKHQLRTASSKEHAFRKASHLNTEPLSPSAYDADTEWDDAKGSRFCTHTIQKVQKQAASDQVGGATQRSAADEKKDGYTPGQILMLNRREMPSESVEKTLTESFAAAQQENDMVQNWAEPFTYQEDNFPQRIDNLSPGFGKYAHLTMDALTIEKTEFGKRKIGTACMQGLRPAMEDAHVVTEFYHEVKNQPPLLVEFVALFDGHTGDQCARYFAQHAEKDIKKALQRVNFDGGEKERHSLTNALTLLFIDRSVKFRQHARENQFNNPGLGSTGLAVLNIQGRLWATSAGDSRAIVVEGNKTIALSVDPRPEKQKYANEVKERGGEVRYSEQFDSYGVTGPKIPYELAMTRALGHNELGTGVSPRAEVITYKPEASDEPQFLVVCCDGVWDVLSNNNVATIVRENKDKPPQKIAEIIVRHAYCHGSRDNLSAIVVPLNNSKSRRTDEKKSYALTTSN